MIKKYRKKPVVIEAVQWVGNNLSDIETFIGRNVKNKETTIVIRTLEGDMEASIGDYIIKGVNGEFYPCKPDIFDKTYEEVKNDVGLVSFGCAIDLLKGGFAVRRNGWNCKGMFVVKQVPSHITSEIIPNMQSLPKTAKDILMKRENPHIDYTNQMLIINPDGRADSWIPSSSDVFAEDWEVVNE